MPERRIVLDSAGGGVAGSAQRWALSRAVRTGHVLHVVSAWQARDGDADRTGPGRLVTTAGHRCLMNHLGAALAGRALLTGELIEQKAGAPPPSRIGPEDLRVVDRDDGLDDEALGLLCGPVVSVPGGFEPSAPALSELEGCYAADLCRHREGAPVVLAEPGPKVPL